MRDPKDPRDDDRAGKATEPEVETMRRLLHHAGPRQEAPAHVVAEIKQATYPAWQSKVRAVAQARRRRRLLILAAAALLAIAAALWRLTPQMFPPGEPPVRVATIETMAGDVTAGGVGDLVPGTELDSGSTIETGASSHLTLRLTSGTSARLDEQTVLQLTSANILELERGAVYLDTGHGPDSPSLTVSTRYGVARDIGTQFEVRLLAEALRIQVREGEVDVELGAASYSVDAGDTLTVDADGTVHRDDVSAHDPSWAWILQTSPPFELEGRTLGEFLDWVTRETGWQTRFADPALEREITGTLAHGSIAGFRPDQALDLVLPGYGLRYALKDGILVIEQAGQR